MMAVAFWASITVAINRFKVPPVMQTLLRELDIGMVTGGLLMSSVSVATILLAVPSAFLLTRLGPKTVGVLALGCSVIGSTIGALAPSITPLLLGRIVEGVGVGLIGVVAPAVISMWFPPATRGLPMGIWAAWVPVGNVIIFNLAHPLADSFDWRAVWWFGTAAALSALVIFGLVVTTPPHAKKEGRSATGREHSFGRMLFNPTAWLLGLAFATFAFSLLGYNTWAPSYLSENLGIDIAAANRYTSLMFLAAIPANVIAGWMMNRTRHRGRLLTGAFVVSTLLFVWSFSLPSAGVVIVYMAALGFATNFIPTSVFTLAPETMPTVRLAGLGLAMAMIGSGLGGLAGPPVLGSILSGGDWIKGSVSLVLVMALGTVVSVVAARRLRRVGDT
jgi:MFS family permease